MFSEFVQKALVILRRCKSIDLVRIFEVLVYCFDAVDRCIRHIVLHIIYGSRNALFQHALWKTSLSLWFHIWALKLLLLLIHSLNHLLSLHGLLLGILPFLLLLLHFLDIFLLLEETILFSNLLRLVVDTCDGEDDHQNEVRQIFSSSCILAWELTKNERSSNDGKIGTHKWSYSDPEDILILLPHHESTYKTHNFYDTSKQIWVIRHSKHAT